MDDFQTDDPTEAAHDDPLSTDPGPAWSGLARGPRPPAEGVRIIGAEEAAAAIEAGQVSLRVPEDAPRFGDVPEPPPGPTPPLRFPGSDPAAVAKPAVVIPDPPPPPPAPAPAPPPVQQAPLAPPAPAPASGSLLGAPPPPPSAAPSYTAGGPVESLWSDSYERRTLAPDPSEPWDAPVVPTAPPGRFEELVAAAAKAEAEAQARSGADRAEGDRLAGPGPGPEPELRQVTPDRPLTSDPVSGEWAIASGLGGGIAPAARAGRGRSLPLPDSGAPLPSNWDRLTGTASGRGQVSERGSWDFIDEPAPEGDEQEAPAPAESTMSLPHWTEPPTGDVPRILGDAPAAAGAPPAADDELSAWSALSTGPRWRDQPADWDEADFSDTVLDDREARLGALRDRPEPADEDGIFAFDDAVAAPPVPAQAATRGGRGTTATQVRPPARSRQGRGDIAARRGPGGGPGGPAGPVGPGGGPGGGGGGSDLSTRVVTGIIAAGVLLAAAAIGPRALVVVVLAAVVLSAAELFQSLRARGYQPATLLGLVACGAMVLGAYWKGETAFPLVLSLLAIFSFLWYLAGVVHAKPTMNIAVTLFAFVYVGFLASYASLFLRVPGGRGVGLLLGAVIATAANDIGAYAVGKYMGKTPLAPELSPNKTFEGLVGGVLSSVFVSLLVVRAIGPWDTWKAFWLGVVVAIAAPLGDLCESMIKRDLGVKDMGKLLPGHGGILDRVDALLFVIPATYYLARLLFR